MFSSLLFTILVNLTANTSDYVLFCLRKMSVKVDLFIMYFYHYQLKMLHEEPCST